MHVSYKAPWRSVKGCMINHKPGLQKVRGWAPP
jgi:hypothetical protein